MTPQQKRKSLSAENDDLALRWAGPFGYAVLQTLRLMDHHAEADFAAFARKAPRTVVEAVVDGVRVQQASYAPAAEALASVRAVAPQVTMSEANPYGSVPDFAGDPTPEPYVSRVAPSPVTEPPPPAEFYRRVTRGTAGRPGQPAPPAGAARRLGALRAPRPLSPESPREERP